MTVYMVVWDDVTKKLGRRAVPPDLKLSNLVIDVDKDWNAKSIDNVNDIICNSILAKSSVAGVKLGPSGSDVRLSLAYQTSENVLASYSQPLRIVSNAGDITLDPLTSNIKITNLTQSSSTKVVVWDSTTKTLGWNEGVPPGSHTHLRSDVTDFWSTPFWTNIPDKPSTYPPNAHASSHEYGGSDLVRNLDYLAIRGTTVIDTSRRLQNIASIYQHLLPTSDNSYDLGSSTSRWKNLFLSGVLKGGFSLDQNLNPAAANTYNLGNPDYYFTSIVAKYLAARDPNASTSPYVGLIKFDSVNNRIVFRNETDSAYIKLDPNCYDITAHTHTRSQITDFWSTPFWANIPDKPSTYPPSAHASSHEYGGSDQIRNLDYLAIRGTTVIASNRVLGNITGIAQHMIPALDNTFDLGSSSLRWKNIFASGVLKGGFSIDQNLNPAAANTYGLGSGDAPWAGVVAQTGYFNNIKTIGDQPFIDFKHAESTSAVTVNPNTWVDALTLSFTTADSRMVMIWAGCFCYITQYNNGVVEAILQVDGSDVGPSSRRFYVTPYVGTDFSFETHHHCTLNAGTHTIKLRIYSAAAAISVYSRNLTAMLVKS